jgi:hypothetical protein
MLYLDTIIIKNLGVFENLAAALSYGNLAGLCWTHWCPPLPKLRLMAKERNTKLKRKTKLGRNRN